MKLCFIDKSGNYAILSYERMPISQIEVETTIRLPALSTTLRAVQRWGAFGAFTPFDALANLMGISILLADVASIEREEEALGRQLRGKEEDINWLAVAVLLGAVACSAGVASKSVSGGTVGCGGLIIAIRKWAQNLRDIEELKDRLDDLYRIKQDAKDKEKHSDSGGDTSGSSGGESSSSGPFATSTPNPTGAEHPSGGDKSDSDCDGKVHQNGDAWVICTDTGSSGSKPDPDSTDTGGPRSSGQASLPDPDSSDPGTPRSFGQRFLPDPDSSDPGNPRSHAWRIADRGNLGAGLSNAALVMLRTGFREN